MNELPETSTTATPATLALATTEAATTTAATAIPHPEAAQSSPLGGGIASFAPFILLFAIFYFMMIRPQQRKEKARQAMIAELRAGKRVNFAGGLIGTIKEAKEHTFIIEICNDVTVEVSRGAVAGVTDETSSK